MELCNIRVCIFDVNGVLIDSNPANALAMAKAFTDDAVLQDRIVHLYFQLTGIDRGTKIRMIQKRIIGGPFREGEFELRWEKVKGLVRESMGNAPLLPGTREVLGELGKRKINRVALSNTPRVELEAILAAQNLDALLELIRGGGDWPKSESLGRLLREFQIDREKAIFFGDGKGDLEAAREAGILFVAIDPGRGEFVDQEGFEGPYANLGDWGKEVGIIRADPEREEDGHD